MTDHNHLAADPLRTAINRAKCNRNEDSVWDYAIHPTQMLAVLDERDELRKECEWRGLLALILWRKEKSSLVYIRPGIAPGNCWRLLVGFEEFLWNSDVDEYGLPSRPTDDIVAKIKEFVG